MKTYPVFVQSDSAIGFLSFVKAKQWAEDHNKTWIRINIGDEAIILQYYCGNWILADSYDGVEWQKSFIANDQS